MTDDKTILDSDSGGLDRPRTDSADPDTDFPESATAPDPGQTTPGAAAKDPTARRGDVSGQTIGPYRLIRELGEGGMGTVYLAEQREPVRREVALKIIRAGMDSSQVIARFQAERQALALMEHASIAKVLDAGTTEHGLPYFVMELVRGQSITDFCDERRLSIPDRLKLFIQVCSAVQHAHLKGIIHRDLKPSNILVTLQDDVPTPKVIDFGLAKAMDQSLMTKSMFTAHGQVLGTPEYMSPEQARMNDLDVDTRSDIYSLGILLYELLTGSTPLTRESLQDCSFFEFLDRIRKEEPERPSSRISDSYETLATLSAARRMEPRRFSMAMQGDLDWIVLKAIEKDRTRRYQTANAFAEDVQRYLSDEPVEARPPSTLYRLEKLVRKHRIAFGFAATVLVLLVAGIGVSTWLAVWATDEARAALASSRVADAEREKAQVAADLAEERRRAADTARLEAVASERRAIRILDVVTDSFRNISPVEGATWDMPASEALRRAWEQLDTRLADDPIARAALLHTLSTSFDGLGDYQAAVQTAAEAVLLRTQEFGQTHRDSLASLRQLSRAHRQSGDYATALELANRLVALSTQVLGPDDPDTLEAMQALAAVHTNQLDLDEAIPLLENTLSRRQAILGADHPDTLQTMHALAVAHYNARDWEKAASQHQATLELRRRSLGPDHPATLQTMNALAATFAASGQTQKAIELYEESLKAEQTRLGDDHPDTLRTMSTLASLYARGGDVDRAIDMSRTTLKKQRARLGDDHPDTLWSMQALASRYYEKGDLENATATYQQALDLQITNLGEDHPSTLNTRHNLGTMYLNSGYPDRAVEMLTLCRERRERLFGPNDPRTLDTMNNLGNACLDAGDVERAVALHTATLDGRRATCAAGDSRILLALRNLARALDAAADMTRLIPVLREILTTQQAEIGESHAETLTTMFQLAQAYRQQGEFDQAIALHEQTLEKRRDVLGEDHFDTRTSQNELAVARAERDLAQATAEYGSDHPESLQAMFRLAIALADNQQIEQAIGQFETVLEKQTATLPVTSPDRLDTMYQLALAHYGRGELEPAIALLKDVVDGRGSVLGEQHADTVTAMEKLVLCYRRTKQPKPALPLCEAIVSYQTESLGPEDPTTLKSLHNLAVVCFGAGEQDRGVAIQNRVLAVQKKQLAAAHREQSDFAKAIRFAGESEQKYVWLHEHAPVGGTDLHDAAAMADLQSDLHEELDQLEPEIASRKRAIDYRVMSLDESASDVSAAERIRNEIQSLLARLPAPAENDPWEALREELATRLAATP